jgi:hypothetical protein
MPHWLFLNPLTLMSFKKMLIENSYLRQELTFPLEHGHLSIRHFCQFSKDLKWIENIRKWADAATYQLKS